jgi:hypothetical protein
MSALTHLIHVLISTVSWLSVRCGVAGVGRRRGVAGVLPAAAWPLLPPSGPLPEGPGHQGERWGEGSGGGRAGQHCTANNRRM